MASEATGNAPNAWSSKNEAVGNGNAAGGEANANSNRVNNSTGGAGNGAGAPAKSIVGNFKGAELIRTSSAPPSMAAPALEKKQKKKNKRNQSNQVRATTNTFVPNSNAAGQMMMNASTNEYVPQFMPNVPYFNPYQGPFTPAVQHQQPPQQQTRSRRNSRDNRDRARRHQRNNGNGYKQPNQYANHQMNFNPHAAAQQQQIYMQQAAFAHQQQQLFAAQHGGMPPRGGWNQGMVYGAQPFVPQQGYANRGTGNPATLWTHEAAKPSVNANTAQPTSTTTTPKPPVRERKPLEIKDKDGNPIVIVSKQTPKEPEAPEASGASADVAKLASAVEAVSISEDTSIEKITKEKAPKNTYTVDELRALKEKALALSERPKFLVDLKFDVDNRRFRGMGGGGYHNNRHGGGSGGGRRGAGSLYSNTGGPSSAFAAANTRKVGSSRPKSEWVRGQAQPKAKEVDDQKRRQKEQQEKAFASFREGRQLALGQKETWSKKEVVDPVEKAKTQAQSLLNKLTKDKFEKIFLRFKEEIDFRAGEKIVEAVVDKIFDKALGEHYFSDIYAQLSQRFSKEYLKVVKKDGKFFISFTFGEPLAGDPDNGGAPFETEESARRAGKKLNWFRKVLLNKCSAEFQKGQTQGLVQDEINKLKQDTTLSADDKKVRIFQAQQRRKDIKKRSIGNILFIGWLYTRQMLTDSIMHECIKSLLQTNSGAQNQLPQPDEENLEALCKLFETIGKLLEDKKMQGKKYEKSMQKMNMYFVVLEGVTKQSSISNRVKFMVLDLIELRRNNWRPRRKKETAKTKEQVREEAMKEAAIAQAQAQRNNNNSGGQRYQDNRNNNRGGGRRDANGRNGQQFRGNKGDARNNIRPPPVQEFKNLKFPGRGGVGGRPGGNMGRPGGNMGRPGGNMGRPGGNMGRPGGNMGRMRPQFSANSNARKGSQQPENSSSMNNAGKQPRSSEPSMPPEKVKASLKSTVKEYISIEDIGEAKACIHDLPPNSNRETFLIEVCADIIVDEREASRKKVFSMIKKLAEEKVIKDRNIVEGLKPIFEFLDDILIDVPRAGEWFGQLIGSAVSGGVPDAVVKQVLGMVDSKHHSSIQKGVSSQ